MTTTEYVTIRHNGKIYKIRKSPYETDEKALDRGWYIINNYNELSIEKETLSHIWANQKYFNMNY